MALENMSKMLRKAKAQKYAVGAFNILDYNSMKAVVEAAEALKAPVIVQTSVKTVQLWGFAAMINWMKELAASATVPIAIHLDHCQEVDFIKKCIDAGWTSVMIDASARPFEENLALTQEVVALAKPHQISVEAELGAIVGVEDDIHVKQQEAHLADVDQSVRMCRAAALDCFAPAIGTAHGLYKGEPKIAFDRLAEIAQKTNLPLALHGGTGLSEAVFKKCIALGCAKVNISTQLKHVFIDAFVNYHHSNPDEYNPLKEINTQYNALKQVVTENIKLFGSAGKAAQEL